MIIKGFHLVVKRIEKMKTKVLKDKNWALPGESLTNDEFKAGIKKAEKETFYTIEESKKLLEEWRKKRNVL